MIRDPSDGTVKEINPPASEINAIPAKTASEGITGPVLETKTSGLPIGKSKAEYLERLEKSREWLRQYFEPKESTDDER